MIIYHYFLQLISRLLKIHPWSQILKAPIFFLPSHVWKNSEFIISYKLNVKNCLINKTFNSHSADDDIVWLYNTLNSCAFIALNGIQTHKNHTFVPKPWWNTNLSKLKKDLSYFYNLWRNSNFTYDDNNAYYCQYKFARKIFRKAVKIAQISYLAKNMLTLIN